MDRLSTEALQVLQERRRALRALVAGEAQGGGEVDETRDLAAFIQSADIERQLSARERNELREIDGAIERIRAGTYGECATCGRAIGHQRLKAMPEARQCLTCASRASPA